MAPAKAFTIIVVIMAALAIGLCMIPLIDRKQ